MYIKGNCSISVEILSVVKNKEIDKIFLPKCRINFNIPFYRNNKRKRRRYIIIDNRLNPKRNFLYTTQNFFFIPPRERWIEKRGKVLYEMLFFGFYLII